ncbi:putative ATP-dependent RNA helicase BoYb [Drosophila pseudoobscura]|uniref:RNA helicase n=1 Tax=Drosophila pseudoobscura pseudoobscura TaxID=46245 RepID=A0A6I8UYW6_DROPS|nr:putative ATP-dependent RNA helicase BoYb [Drosophila pseudoobscura]
MSDTEKKKLRNYENTTHPLIGANCSDYVVAHATVSVTPFRTFAEVTFLPDILAIMRKLGLNRLLRVQSYAWPHLLKGPGHGVLIVSAPRSGRTMGYVPPVCHVVTTILAANRRKREVAVDLLDISHRMGPIALIIVPDLNRLAQVAALCHALMPKKESVDEVGIIVTRVLTVPMECTPDFMGAWLNEIGVLVATPARFAKACKQGAGLLKLNLLQLVVFDDVDLMQKEELELAMQYIPSMAKSNTPMRKGTNHCPRPQVVMVSQHFTPSLFAQVQRFNQHPCLIFGDFLEAAHYGGMRLSVNIGKKEDKVGAVVKLLRQRPPEKYRTIIFCDGDLEMALLVGALKDFEYDCLAYYQNADLALLEKVSHWTCTSRGSVFVCTENCPELKIRNAYTIIHYSMSSSLTKFKNRHMFLSDNVPNVLTRAKAHSLSASPTAKATATDESILFSLVLLDEGNDRQLPRLVDLVQARQKLEPNIVAMAARIRQEINSMKGIVKPICGEILGHGDCWYTNCGQRHYLHRSDRRPSYVPCSGDIKVQVLRVYSPGHYCVIAYEHKPLGGKWHTLDLNRNLMALMNLRLEEPLPRYWPPLPQAVCLWKRNSRSFYERVRVLSVPPIENVNLVQSNLMVVVQAMDSSTRCFETKCTSLHVCPDEYASKPPLCMDLRLLGMVNHMGDRYWADGDANTVQGWLDNAPKDHFVQAKVAFSTSHTIFATCMVSMVYLKTLKTFNQHLNLLKAQIEAKMSKRCARTKQMILKFFEEHIKLDEPPIPQDPPELEKEPNSCEGVRVVANVSKENIGEDMDKSPPSKQDTSKLPAMDPVDHGPKTGPENRLRQEDTDSEEEADSKQSPVMPVGQDQPGESEASDLKVVPISDFYDCFMRCAALEGYMEMEADKAGSKAAPNDVYQMLTEGPVQRSNEPSKDKSKQEKSQQIKGEKLSANFPTEVSAYNAARVLQPASRPDVKYYQTLRALHLQVTLVDEKMSYQTRVVDTSGVFFQATPTSGSGAYEACEFFVNTCMAFKGIQHSMNGRTVYIELRKMNPGYYPINFGHLKFFQNNFDKREIEEMWQQRNKNKLQQLMREHGWGVQKYTKAESSDESVSESESEDGVERPDDYRKIYMD